MAKAKTANPLAGLSAEARKRINAQIKEEKEAARKVADKDYDILYDNLVSLRNKIEGIIQEEWLKNTLPNNTTMSKLASLPKSKPKLVGNYVKKKYSRGLANPEKPVVKSPTVKRYAKKTPATKMKPAIKTPPTKKPAAKKK